MKTSKIIAFVSFIALTFMVQAQIGYRSPNPSNMNISYEMAIKPQFDNVALDFSEGMACVLIQRGQFHSYIDTTGKPAFDRQFLNVGQFHDGIACVEIDRKWGYINKNGNDITTEQYAYMNDFQEGYTIVFSDVTGGGHYRCTFMDTEGKMVSVPRFLNAKNFSEGYAPVQGNNKNWQVLNKRFVATSGPLPYDDIAEFHEGLARVKIGDRYGFIDTLGNLKIPMRDGWCDRQFSEGLCIVSENGKYGYMDTYGRIVIPCQYTLAEPFSCSRAIVSQAGPEESGMIAERGVIDHEGNWVVKEKQFDGINSFSEDYAVVAKDGKFGFINVNGKVVIPMIYEKARDFHEGYAAVRVNKKWGFLKLTNVDEKMKMIGY